MITPDPQGSSQAKSDGQFKPTGKLTKYSSTTEYKSWFLVKLTLLIVSGNNFIDQGCSRPRRDTGITDIILKSLILMLALCFPITITFAI